MQTPLRIVIHRVSDKSFRNFIIKMKLFSIVIFYLFTTRSSLQILNNPELNVTTTIADDSSEVYLYSLVISLAYYQAT